MKHKVFVAADISIAPKNISEWYNKIMEACSVSKEHKERVYSPLNSKGDYEKRIKEALKEINESSIGIFYLGFNSFDVGKMLGRAKFIGKPVIFLYEVDKESWLRMNEPKIWWKLKNREELLKDFPRGEITPNSYVSFLVPESTYEHIFAEIKYKTENEALSKLEKEVKRFFSYNQN